MQFRARLYTSIFRDLFKFRMNQRTNVTHWVCLLPIYASDRFKLMEIINKQNDWPAPVPSMMLEAADIMQTYTCGCRMRTASELACGGKRMSMVFSSFLFLDECSSVRVECAHRKNCICRAFYLNIKILIAGNGIVCVVVDDDNLQTGC